MKTILMVAEKPALALSLAQILSNGKCRSRKGFNGACSVHEYEGTFQGELARYKMTSVCGHVMSIDFISSYNNWDRVDPAELFQAPTEKKEANPNLQIPRLLQQEARNCDYLVLWLDCDKEGENICYEVINAVKHLMKVSTRSYDQTVFRARFSAITEKDIKAAMNQLVLPNENEARSVDARQELDLRIGCAFTRFQTKFFQGKYGNLDSSLISFGPCQTPTLGFCVDRHDQIQSFKPEPYWVIQPHVTTPGGTALLLDWERVRMFDQDVAQFFLQGIKNKKEAVVTDVVQKKQSRQPPLALNTVELMRVASSGLNMGPHHAMQIAERLYTQGFISYPRTETTSYPENFDIRDVLQQLVPNSEFGEEARALLRDGIHKPRKGHDAGDHPPITPTKLASRTSLDGDSWRLYDYIARHFIATVSPEMTYLQTVITFSIGDEWFSSSGKTLIDPGFTKVFIWQALSMEESVPTLKKGDVCSISEIKLLEKKTCPPDYLTEAELITLMEKHAIGTDASIPVHINNICQRNYVTVIAGRRLQPTALGIVLVHGYQKIDIDLVLPTMRASVEKQLTLIAQGLAQFESVLQHTLTIFQLKFQFFVTNILGMDELFEATFSSLSDIGKPISKCGRCRRYMKLIDAKLMRLHCPSCDETYSVPQNGTIKLYCELKCPLDDFELLQWIGNKNKSYIFCPYCYMNPPSFPGARPQMGCNACSHPTCPHSMSNNGISSCPRCDYGVLVLDPASGPKWKLSCNQCDVVVQLFDGALKLTVEDEPCETCTSQLVTVSYKQEKSKLPGGKKEAKGCIFCDESLSALVEKPQTFRPKSFRGRGRGRGGATRGRGGRGGKRRPRDKMDELAAYFV